MEKKQENYMYRDVDIVIEINESSINRSLLVVTFR